MDENNLSSRIIGAAIIVHKELGPGLLEYAYEECLAFELASQNIPFERQKQIPARYRNIDIDCGFRIDLLVGGLVIVELKAVESLAPIHTAQVLNYLKLSNCKLGLLINFNVIMLKSGIKRLVLNI
jgi:GxxExxY protein